MSRVTITRLQTNGRGAVGFHLPETKAWPQKIDLNGCASEVGLWRLSKGIGLNCELGLWDLPWQLNRLCNGVVSWLHWALQRGIGVGPF